MDDPGLRIGIDLGGTKIEGLALASDGSDRARQRIPAPQDDYEATVWAIADLVTALEAAAGATAPATVGIGMPGSISPATGRVQNANSIWLNGRPLGVDIERRLGRPVRLANDANCFAVSEATDGAGAGARSVFGVILGTGCGGGLVVDGRLFDGPRGIGGEWGHNPLPWADADEHPGPQCWCGRVGCMETWVSGPGLARDHRAMAVRSMGGAHGPTTTLPAALDAEGIVRRAQVGDAEARASLDRHASRLARGLACVVNMIDPDVIVLGGGLSNVANLYEVLPELMAPWIFCDAPTVRVVPPQWGDSSGVRGAAWLWG